MQKQLSMRFRFRLALLNLFDVLCKIPRWRTLQRTLTRVAESSDDFFFIQIGANDGVIYDPIYKFVQRYHWSGVMVEPVRHYFELLQVNYRGNNKLHFENVAVSDRDEIRDFYRVKEGLDFLPEWCNGLGTFDLDVLLTHKWAIPNLEDYVVKEQVACISLEGLLRKYNIQNLDLLLIDTEGYDYQILKQLDLDVIRPELVLYEHQYINQIEKDECEKRFRQYGYTLSSHLGNTLAYSI